MVEIGGVSGVDTAGWTNDSTGGGAVGIGVGSGMVLGKGLGESKAKSDGGGGILGGEATPPLPEVDSGS